MIIHDLFHQLRIKLIFRPRDVRPVYSDSRGNAVHAVFFTVIKKYYRITERKAHFIRPAVIAVNNPFFSLQDSQQAAVKFPAGNMCPVRLPPDIVKMKKRQAGSLMQASCQAAFSAARAAKNDDSVPRCRLIHQSVSPQSQVCLLCFTGCQPFLRLMALAIS